MGIGSGLLLTRRLVMMMTMMWQGAVMGLPVAVGGLEGVGKRVVGITGNTVCNHFRRVGPKPLENVETETQKWYKH